MHYINNYPTAPRQIKLRYVKKKHMSASRLLVLLPPFIHWSIGNLQNEF